jgi:hypothetical protein
MSAANTNRSGVLKLWLLNLVGNAVVLAAWYYWLLIPDAHGWQVVWSAVLASLVVVFVLWLRAGTLIYFRVAEFRNKPTIDVAFRRGFRHIVPLALWAALGAAIAWLILQAGNYTPQFSVWIRQKANAGLPPRGVMHASDWVLVVLFWVMFPALWAPVATTIAATGFSGRHIARSFRVLRQPLYWILLCILIALGAWVPYKLVTWVPDATTLRSQAWSAGLRFAMAYMVSITAFILLVWMVGERTEREDPIA